MNSGGPPGGLQGTADACPGPLPYQDPSARHSATLYTHTRMQTQTHTHTLSVFPSCCPTSVPPPLLSAPSQQKPREQYCRPDGRIFLEASQSLAWLAEGGGGGGGGGGLLRLERFPLLTKPPQLSWQWLEVMTHSILCLWLLVTAGPMNVSQWRLHSG